MRRFLSVLLALMILFTVSTASAYDFVSLKKLQDYIYYHSTAEMMNIMSTTVMLRGTIQSVDQVTGNHWQMIIAVDEPDAAPPIWSDDPVFIAHFRLHVDPCPVAVGDEVTVSGSFNPLYSSFLVPSILVETINGSEDF